MALFGTDLYNSKYIYLNIESNIPILNRHTVEQTYESFIESGFGKVY